VGLWTQQNVRGDGIVSNGLVYVPVSVGELYDKISILEIKLERVQDAPARQNVAQELELLRAVEANHGFANIPQLNDLVAKLREINRRIWRSEDAVRSFARNDDWSTDYLTAARASYSNNDERAKVKREINDLTGSLIVEEKYHETGKRDG
jgi:hypothetical protein